MKTGKKAWIGQRSKDITTKGKAKSPWIVFWNTPDDKRREKSCGPGRDGRRLAEKLKERIHSELVSGTYGDRNGGTWSEFRERYESHAVDRLSPGSNGEIRTSLGHFERLMHPGKMSTISTMTIDDYVAARRKERGKKKRSTVSPATVNKELRHLRAALRKARKWRYLSTLPDFEFIPEPESDPTYMTPEDFRAIYHGCEAATKPSGLPYEPEVWWQALLATAYMTGWRIGETLQLRRDDIDLEAGTARLRARTTKGRRHAVVRLHPVVIEHIKGIATFGEFVFPWHNHRRTLDTEFHRIQQAAGIHLPCDEDHEHTDACHLYGFHDERRAFATLNAGQLTADALQALMRHRSYQTTQKYISMAPQMDGAVDLLHVPEVLLAATGGK